MCTQLPTRVFNGPKCKNLSLGMKPELKIREKDVPLEEEEGPLYDGSDIVVTYKRPLNCTDWPFAFLFLAFTIPIIIFGFMSVYDLAQDPSLCSALVSLFTIVSNFSVSTTEWRSIRCTRWTSLSNLWQLPYIPDHQQNRCKGKMSFLWNRSLEQFQ